jgi:hypothetical protein
MAEAELWIGGTGTFAASFPMTHPRSAHTSSTLQDGRILVAGGFANGQQDGIYHSDGQAVAEAEVFQR